MTMPIKKELSRYLSEDGRLVIVVSQYEERFILDALFDGVQAHQVQASNEIQAGHLAEDIVLRYDAGEVDEQ